MPFGFPNTGGGGGGFPAETRQKRDAEADFTITLASLASAAGRQSTMVANPNNRPRAMIYVRIKSGAVAPTNGAVYEVYLVRGDLHATPYRTDGAGAADAALTVENATLLGAIAVTNTANKLFYGEFDTAPAGPLGAEWGIAIRNQSGQALNATEGDHLKRYVYMVPETV